MNWVLVNILELLYTSLVLTVNITFLENVTNYIVSVTWITFVIIYHILAKYSCFYNCPARQDKNIYLHIEAEFRNTAEIGAQTMVVNQYPYFWI